MGVTQDAVRRALAWLATAQAPTGELPSWASPLEGAPDWTEDSLKFVTALATIALATVDDPAAEAIVERAVGFLRSEREPFALWRYWSTANEQFAFTPADADDTACCSLAVAALGDDTHENVPLLLKNRDRAGRFRTWFVPHPGTHGLRWRRAMRAERTAATRDLREALWETTEAEMGDVDVVVNANVCRYLGPSAPADAAEWVATTLRDGPEVGADKWHRNPTTFYASVADGAERGVAAFAAIEGVVVDRITERWRSGSLITPLDQAQSLLALQAFSATTPTRAALARALAESQADDGSWARSIFYYGGPREVFGWASEALATAYAASALGAEGRC